MTVAKSTKARPCKPYPAFTLFAKTTGNGAGRSTTSFTRWQKWQDTNAALKKHNRLYASLKEGFDHHEGFGGCRVGDSINEFLSVHKNRKDLGEIEQVTFDSLVHVGKLSVEFIPKTRAVDSLKPADF